MLETIREDLEKLKLVLKEARDDYAVDFEGFKKAKIFRMGRFIRLYHEFMSHLDVELDTDTENALRELVGNDSLVNELNLFKSEWDSFLREIETNVIY